MVIEDDEVLCHDKKSCGSQVSEARERVKANQMGRRDQEMRRLKNIKPIWERESGIVTVTNREL
jgi:hypothetical protein